MSAEKTLLIFCEGPHDVAFCTLIFRQLFAAKRNTSWRLEDYPAPFNSLFAQILAQHLVNDLNLDIVHQFFLPHVTLQKNEWLILIFNCGGGLNKTTKAKQFIQDYLLLSEQVSIFPQGADAIIKESRFLFTYDMDDNSMEGVLKKFHKEFEMIGEDKWLDEQLTISTYRNIASCSDKGICIWADSHSLQGTLENITLPLYESAHKDLVDNATRYIDGFNWNSTISDQAKRKKAIITALGQRKKPGGSMAVVLSQSKLLTHDHLAANSDVKIFCELIKTLTGLATT